METKSVNAESEMIPIDEETLAAIEAAGDTARSNKRPRRKKEGNGVAKKAKKAMRARTKAKAAKVKTAKSSARATPSQGQNGPAIDLTIDDMNKGEKKVLELLHSTKGERKAYTLAEIQKECFRGKPGTSATRNALRRLVRAGWAEKYERGTYRLTDKARKRSFKKG